jgi:hypothetical protein
MSYGYKDINLIDDDERLALWLNGEDVFDEDRIETNRHHELMRTMPLEYVKRQLNILEDIANDLRRQGDRLREEVRKMRQLISEDDF